MFDDLFSSVVILAIETIVIDESVGMHFVTFLIYFILVADSSSDEEDYGVSRKVQCPPPLPLEKPRYEKGNLLRLNIPRAGKVL